MPTRRGWEVVLGALGVVLAGRILGLVQLYVVGVAGLILLVAAVAWVRLSPVKVEASRRLRPSRVPVGATAHVELRITNTSHRRSPLLEVRDAFGAGRTGARFLVAPLAPGDTGRTSYCLDAEARGVFEVGPLEVQVGDPFGLATTTTKMAKGTVLTVLPRIEAISPPRRSAGGASPGGALRPPLSGQSGDSFYSLREYAAGDDLRRVHWASTARRDQLMIRQDDQSVQDRTTVVLDLRGGDAELFETVVSAAASVLCAASASLVRLVDTAGHDSGYGTGPAHTGALLDRLAAATADPPGLAGPDVISRGLSRLRNGPGGGTVVMVTAAGLERGLSGRLAGLGARFTELILVAVGVERGGPLRSVGTLRVIPVPPGQGFASAWTDGLRRATTAASRGTGPSRGASV